MREICKIGCILENLAKKAPNLPQIGCFLQKKWYRDGLQNHAFRGIEMVEILNSFEHPRTPPPPRGENLYTKNGCKEIQSPKIERPSAHGMHQCFLSRWWAILGNGQV